MKRGTIEILVGIFVITAAFSLATLAFQVSGWSTMPLFKPLDIRSKKGKPEGSDQ